MQAAPAAPIWPPTPRGSEWLPIGLATAQGRPASAVRGYFRLSALRCRSALPAATPTSRSSSTNCTTVRRFRPPSVTRAGFRGTRYQSGLRSREIRGQRGN
jgi:hypothetical protein